MAIDTKKLKETAGTIFTAKHLKKAALAAVVLAALGGIGSYGIHSYKEAHRAEAQALQQQLLQKSVEQANERRADGAAAPQPAQPAKAQTIQHNAPGANGAATSQNARLLTPEEIRSIVASFIGQDETAITFRSIELKYRHQIYDVECTTGSGLNRIEYELDIDAISGAVLKSEVDYD